MSIYDGLEIDMISLGKADSILVTKRDWWQSTTTRVLIDGGNKGSAHTVRAFLRSRDVTYVDHVVCSHPHDDHAAGLVELVKDPMLEFGKAWMHMPWLHVDTEGVKRELSKAALRTRANMIKKSLQTAEDLHSALQSRDVPVEEPFDGKNVGFFKVCGPTKYYYEQLLDQFTDTNKLAEQTLDDIYYKFRDVVEKLASPDTLEDNPTTSPENNSSVILRAEHGGEAYLFTADAGAQALEKAKFWHSLEGCEWMKIPHHGSRRNITTKLIEHFRPVKAFVSADGSDKHPNPVVVDAFKKVGTKVFSTHYPVDNDLWIGVGDVPARPGYTLIPM
jgi:beta-lactamase superfamily II metal-dependent hydrolase